MDFIAEQKEIFEHFGIEKQKEKLFEEFIELKVAFKKLTVDEIRSELADVHNILMQIVDYYGTKEIYDIAVKKIERTKKRIEEGYYD